jgi:rod shape-determining protein MreB
MIKLAIDLGSSVTKIYRADANNGVALFEPSCVAVTGEDEKVVAIGKEAKKVLGKTTGETDVVYPVYEGAIAQHELAVKMLKEFLRRAELSSSVRRSETVFAVPCGIGALQLHEYKELATRCGFKRIHFVETPYLAVYGSGVTLTDEHPVFTMDIGASVTNIAVVSAGGMNAGISINVGGNAMDLSIWDMLATEKGLHIGTLTSERIKNEIGSLSENARGTTIAEGISTETYMPSSVSVRAQEIAPCIRVYVDKIIEYAGDVLRTLPAEVSANVHRNGVFLSGGMMKLPGLPQYIGAKLEMRYHLCEEPQFATVLGGGAVVQDKVLLAQLGKETE